MTMSSFLTPAWETFFYWALSLTSFWITGGLFVDGWAHTHGKVDASFFTPYHGILYSGLGAAMAVLGLYLGKGIRAGRSWKHALPPSYRLAFIGGIIFAFGGIFDLLWHTFFGIEIDIDALYSPSHLMLAIGGMLLGSGVFREALRRPDLLKLDFFRDFGVILSFIGFMATILFFTQIAHPAANLWGGAEVRYNLNDPGADWLFRHVAVTGILLTTIILIAGMHLLVARWRLPFGVFTSYIGLSSIGMGFLYAGNSYPWPHVLAFLLGGLVIDILYRILKPSLMRLRAFRVFFLAAPTILMAFYFAAVWLTSGIWWSIHFWTGSILVVSFAGFLMSYVFVSPETDKS